MEKIIADSSSNSQWKERKITLAKELRKFGIDIDNDTAMKVNEATMKSLLVEKAREERVREERVAVEVLPRCGATCCVPT